MKVFYCCLTGAHNSVLAAALHLGLLPLDRFPSKTDIGKLSFFGEQSKKSLGQPRFIGHDGGGNEIFTIGLSKEKKLISKSIEDLMELFGLDKDYFLSDVSDIENTLIHWGQKISGTIGEAIYLQGMKKEFKTLVDEVRTVQTIVNALPSLDLSPNLVDNYGE